MSPLITALALAAVVGSSGERPVVHRYALIIGYNGSADPTRAALRYADDDAARFFELLAPMVEEAHLLTRFDETSQRIFPATVATARPPTRAQTKSAMQQLRVRMEADADEGISSELYFYYAGHGDVVDGEGSITLADGRMTRSDLRQWVLEDSPATVTHLIIDACKAYFLVAGRGPGGQREPAAHSFASPEITAGVGYVLSTSNDADAHEWSAISGGVFSHEVRSALLGAADVDGDGSVDYDELAAFVAVANEPIEYPRFRPQYYVQAPSDRRSARVWTASRLSGAGAAVLDPGESGRVSITDERGLRYADAHKAAGVPLRIVLLPPHRYEATWEGRTYALGTPSADTRLSAQPASPAVVVARSELHLAFERLFSSPYGPDVVRGFRLARTLEAPVVLDDGEAAARRGWTGGLLIGGAALTAAGVALTVASADARSDAAVAAQADRPALDDRAGALGGGAVAAISVGAVSLAAALAIFLLEE